MTAQVTTPAFGALHKNGADRRCNYGIDMKIAHNPRITCASSYQNMSALGMNVAYLSSAFLRMQVGTVVAILTARPE